MKPASQIPRKGVDRMPKHLFWILPSVAVAFVVVFAFVLRQNRDVTHRNPTDRQPVEETTRPSTFSADRKQILSTPPKLRPPREAPLEAEPSYSGDPEEVIRWENRPPQARTYVDFLAEQAKSGPVMVDRALLERSH